MEETTRKYTQRFHNSMDKLMMLSYMEIYLMLWLAEQVDEDNRVETDSKSRSKFVNFTLRVSSKNGPENQIQYSEASVKVAIANLKKHKLLITEPGIRGRCWVNPNYFWRGTPRKRKNMQLYIETKVEDFKIEQDNQSENSID